MKTASLLLSLMLVGISLTAMAAEKNEVDMFTYKNPLNFKYSEGQTEPRSEVRDPCIIREGDFYYLAFTMWPFSGREESRLGLPDQGSSPGIALYSSKDLKDWKFENWLVKSSDLPEDCPYKNRFWAPEIRKINGKFYLVFTADNWIRNEYNPAGRWGTAGYCFIGVSDKITGPYKNITWFKEGTCDTSIFADDDGQVYAIKPKYNIYIQKIDLSGIEKGRIQAVGDEMLAVNCKNDDIGIAVNPQYLEGPWMEKVDGRYYLFFASIYRDKAHPEFDGYRTGVAYSNSPMGPWKKDPRGHVFFGGHLTVFDGPDGRKWFSYRWEKDAGIRGLPCIDPVNIDDKGTASPSEPSNKEMKIGISVKK